MIRTFRSLAFALASVLAVGAMAQNVVTITGTVSPCAGFVYTVHLQANSVPPLDTMVTTGPDCVYSFTYYPVQTQGVATASVSCDGGITWVSGTGAWNPFFGVVTIDLACGNGTVDCLGVLGGAALPGTPCDDGIPATNAYWSIDCVCVPDTIGNFIDCEGVPGGPAMPGTPCDDGDPNTIYDEWTEDCLCVGADTLDYDCNGVLNGPDMPGTACTVPGTILTGIWSPNCVCIPDSNGVFMDCLGVINGPNLPGTPCDDNNPLTENSVWDANCDCVPAVFVPCEADFWVMQAYTNDSTPGGGNGTPIPNVLWVWNLSSGGTGNFTFLWSFGDGTSSTDPFPTHTYPGPGPYNLCLTIADDNGCTSTYCDSISVDEDGMISGMAPGAEVRSTFTINVINPLTLGVHEAPALDELATWPNPVSDELNIQLTSSLRGNVSMDILDLSGRVVLAGNRTLTSGPNRLSLPTGDLNPGMYLLRIGNGAEAEVLRFVKTR